MHENGYDDKFILKFLPTLPYTLLLNINGREEKFMFVHLC